ncbi:uncharacterized protein LOC109595108 [Aethina tumida]|uniref:uncharacterized protein LOC109595108 n=1 Tax=Aethina tumida TaxID=116153 RepID=UPI00096B6382|nr:uncharacterized protein LOC109595108 [Aethina tumida]
MAKLEGDSSKNESNKLIDRRLYKPSPDIFTNYVNRAEGFGTWVENNIADIPKDEIGRRNQWYTLPSPLNTDDKVTSKTSKNSSPCSSRCNRNHTQPRRKNLFKGFVKTTVGITGKAVYKMMKIIGKPFQKTTGLTHLPGATVAPLVEYTSPERFENGHSCLSSDNRNFLYNSPTALEFPFNYEQFYQNALAAMEQDPQLVKIHHDLISKDLPEEVFWRTYCYSVNLISDVKALTLNDVLSSRYENLSHVSENKYSERKVNVEGNTAINVDAVD